MSPNSWMQALEPRMALSGTETVPVITHFTTGAARIEELLTADYPQDNLDFVTTRGQATLTVQPDRGLDTRITYRNADGSVVPQSRSGSFGSQDQAVVNVLGEATERRWFSVDSRYELDQIHQYALTVQGQPGDPTDVARYVREGERLLHRHYEYYGRSSPQNIRTVLSDQQFTVPSGSYATVESAVYNFSATDYSAEGSPLGRSGVFFILEVRDSASQAIRISLDAESGSPGNFILYAASDQGTSLLSDSTGTGGSEVLEVPVSAGATVYVLAEEKSDAKVGRFKLRFEQVAAMRASPGDLMAGYFKQYPHGFAGSVDRISGEWSAYGGSPADLVYSKTDWDGENYWFQSSDGTVWALWHGGAVHDYGMGRHLWSLTNLKEAVGLPSGIQAGTLSGTFTSWRAFNVFGIDHRGDLVSYWWSPESGASSSGINRNGWQLSNISDASTWLHPYDEPSRLSGQTSVERLTSTMPETIQVTVTAGARRFVFWFDPASPGPGDKPWWARAGG